MYTFLVKMYFRKYKIFLCMKSYKIKEKQQNIYIYIYKYARNVNMMNNLL